MRKVGFSVCLVLFLLTTWSYRHAVLAQPNVEYFRETGHWVNGEFLDFYQSADDPLLLYGFPLTEAFPDPLTGRLVQYFEKSRFELYPSEPAGRRVRLTPLGSLLYTRGNPGNPQNESGACRDFPGRPYRVCYSFLEFYEDHGGEARFGRPISNYETHNSTMVQYFEHARFEWRPGLDGRSRVVLSNLGWQYFYLVNEDIRRLAPEPGDNILQGGVLRLRARAYPEQAVTHRSGSQSVYILVQDQRLLAVENADITLMVHLPDGETLRIIAPQPTDSNGITRVPFPFDSDEVGMVRVEIVAQRDRAEARTATSFRIWY